jgi:UDP-2,4-diacetamido-2,4,6-trideoxy-beta-L-altropyranose hydrolase
LIVVRADASPAIGFGHAMRCSALAELTPAVFASAEMAPAMERRLPEVVRIDPADDAEQTIALARERGAEWVVVDSYALGTDYQRALRAAALRVLVIDDHGHAGRYEPDLLLNQNLGARPYPDVAPHTTQLLGTRYALLRGEFRHWRGERSIPARAERLLVTLGGSDLDNFSARVARAVTGTIAVELIAGGANPHRDELARIDGVELTVDADDMPARMARADVAVSAAGSTSWELARTGLPQIAIVLADNQEPAARALAEHGIAVNLGREPAEADIAAAVSALAADRDRREQMSRRAQELVDGKGVARVLAAMGLGAPPR